MSAFAAAVLAVGLLTIAGLSGLSMFLIVIYNRLVALRNRYRNAFAQIDVQMKRRHDLIPNLVETAKGYLKHERNTLKEVTEARAKATQAVLNVKPGDLKGMMKVALAEGQLTTALGKLMVACERYPDLKANENILRIQDELKDTENAIAFSRQTFNDFVTSYNTRMQVFPDTLIAGKFGFDEAALLETSDAEKIAPKVAF
jgi:LemA protein